MSDVYKKAGVDVEAGYEAVERMKKHINKNNPSGGFRWYRFFCRVV